jgi:aryl-alcohol dehydrogenase
VNIKAALMTDPGAPFSIETIELDGPKDDEILVRLVATGVCHTDLAAKAVWPPEARPMVFGHEGAGIVEAVGSGVSSVKEGDRVLLSFRHCRQCPQCMTGHVGYCDQGPALNVSGVRPDGSTVLHRNGTAIFGNWFGQSSFASHAIAYEDNVVVVDDGVDLTVAAPFGCGIQTGAGTLMNTLRPSEGSSFAVFGAGAVGLSALMAAKATGVETIVAVDPVESRRQLATELGATHTVNPLAEDPVEAVRDATGGGADTAIEATAIPAVIRQAVDALASRGVLAVVGVGEPEVTIDITEIINRGKIIRGVVEGDATPQDFIPRLLDMYARGELPVDRMMRQYPFDEIETAVADAHSGATIKPVLVF